MQPTPSSAAAVCRIGAAAAALILCGITGLLLTGRAAAVVATAGTALQTALLVTHHHRAVRRITELEADLTLAYRDPVTGLAVRRVAEKHLADAAGTDVTVALIDVDGMHDINNAHTHDGGDQYLAAVAERLTRAAAPGDVVARLGGDEFVVITARDPHTLAWSLTAAVTPPVTIGAATLPMRVSIGLCRVAGGDPRFALGQADRAMFTAKHRGTGIEVYDPDRDGVPSPGGARPPVRRRDQRLRLRAGHACPQEPARDPLRSN